MDKDLELQLSVLASIRNLCLDHPEHYNEDDEPDGCVGCPYFQEGMCFFAYIADSKIPEEWNLEALVGGLSKR